MDKIHEIAGGGALMPSFDDGMVNMAEPIRVMAESFIQEIVDARGDEACEAGNQLSYIWLESAYIKSRSEDRAQSTAPVTVT